MELQELLQVIFCLPVEELLCSLLLMPCARPLKNNRTRNNEKTLDLFPPRGITFLLWISLKIAQDHVELRVVFPSRGHIDHERTAFAFHENHLEGFDFTGGIAKCINIRSQGIRV